MHEVDLIRFVLVRICMIISAMEGSYDTTHECAKNRLRSKYYMNSYLTSGFVSQ